MKKEKANAIQQVINETEKEIDQMVYELYGLTEDEIKICSNLLHPNIFNSDLSDKKLTFFDNLVMFRQ